MESRLKSCRPVKPAAPYIGGKRNLARRLVARIGSIEHRIYVEPFVGMGGVFLKRPFRADVEVINDYSRDVANLFRILQRHYVPLMDMLRWQVTSRDEFERLKAAEAGTLTDLERAVRFLYLQRLAFGGKVNGRNFGVSLRPARFDVHTLEPVLADIHARLSRVTIECLPFGDVLRRYDRADALFYLDPPYWNCEDDYDAPFQREDFHGLLDSLTRLQGKFIMSLNDTPEVRQMFSGFDIEAVGVSYSLSREAHARGQRGEVLISN
ncbi:DNA adenine methylase [Komagataeibacter medellinensis]|uniref:site-specific DNA-methyltransferase (adenine-specific) n=1 Tax=Komagataeibacter medellinensis TaxID=1177712 RepID=A0ABQ6VY29_9PROT|nr:DNA adenine methylase [Komagataeibacter medellinensis]KAB8124018.1 DNA adenine methylase [Komagataeibacter medellinensis]